MALIDTFNIGEVNIQVHAQTSNFMQFPGVRIEVPDYYRILGGGAQVNWFGVGNILTGMFPEGDRVWVATAKGDKLPNTASITGYCIAGCMKDGSAISFDDYGIVRVDSDPGETPGAEAKLPEGWIIIGGGARTNWTGSGSLLSASHPGSESSWIASAKDHIAQEFSTVSAFAIGIKESFAQSAGLHLVRNTQTSKTPISHPTVECTLDRDVNMISGGAKTNWAGAGSLLTASYPQDRRTWMARGKDHRRPDPSTITAWCIGVTEKT